MNFSSRKRMATGSPPYPGRSLQTLRLIMRAGAIYCMLIITSGLLIQAQAGLGQGLDQHVSVSMTAEPIERLFKKLEQEVGVTFVYNRAIEDIVVTLQASDTPASEVLNMALANTGWTYTAKGNGVAIIPAPRPPPHATPPPSSISFFTISGKITDADTHPLAGVSIIVKGTTRGTTSDTEGRYTLDVQSDETLVFTFIGFKPVETEVGQRTSLDITLQEDVTSLDAVQVVGNTYYSTAKEVSVSSIVKVTAKEIENQPVTSPLIALQGRVAGLEISPMTGSPGNAPSIRIRGMNSLRSTSNSPLIVIDGIPIDSRPIKSSNSSANEGSNLFGNQNGYDPLTNISPSNIESIEVLKDGDATAIYGSRGANGVVVIRTKKSQKSAATAFDLTAYTGIGKITHFLDMMDREEYLTMRREAFYNDKVISTQVNAPDLLVWDTTRSTDVQRALLGGSSHISDVQGNLSGGNENTSFRFGGGYHRETTIFPGDFGYQRMNGQLSVNHNSADKRFNALISVIYGENTNKQFADGLVGLALTLPPIAPDFYTKQGDLNWALDESGNSTFTNPLALTKKLSKAKQSNLVASTLLSYKITPALSLRSNMGYTNISSNEVVLTPLSSMTPQERTQINTGESTFGTSQRVSFIIEPQLAYNKVFGHHNLDIFIATSYQPSQSSAQSIRATGYTSDVMLESVSGATNFRATADQAQYKYASLMTHIGYNFSGKYLVSLTGRRDGSSRFGPGNRWGNFGSAGVGWVFSNESLIHDQDILSFGKIRGSYAITGSDQIGDYSYYSVYTKSAINYQAGTSLTPLALYNPNYQWEATRKIEVGLELGFIQNRFMLEVNSYRNRSFDQLIDYKLPATTGFSSVIKNFEAVIQNRGWEFMLSTRNFSTGKFKWTTTANITLPQNRLLAFPDIENSPYATKYKVGEPLSIRNELKYQGVDQETGRYRFFDVNSDGNIDDNDKSFGQNLERKFYGGVTNSFQLYGLELSILFQFTKQPTGMFSQGAAGTIRTNQPKYLVDRWRQSDDRARFAKYSFSTNASTDYSNLFMSDFSIIDGSFVRLKTLTLSYSLPSSVTQKAKLTEARIIVQGQNLLTWTSYFNLDPETGAGLPPLRVWTVGLNVKI